MWVFIIIVALLFFLITMAILLNIERDPMDDEEQEQYLRQWKKEHSGK